MSKVLRSMLLLVFAQAVLVVAGAGPLAPGAAAAPAAPVPAPSPAQTAPGRRWICPPCGQPCDARVFDRPGTCPECGMALVEQGAADAPKDTRTRVAILLFNGVEIIDYTGPYELFGAANDDVFTVAASTQPVTTAMGMTVVPRYSFADAPRPDVLVVPGGGVRGAMADSALLAYVRAVSAGAKHTMSVCNGSFILASAGLLDGLVATSTYGNVMSLHAEFPRVKVVGNRRWVDNGRIITTAGLSAGMDGALHVIARMRGEKVAREVALSEEYAWSPHGGYVRPPLADRLIPTIDLPSTARATRPWNLVRAGGDAARWTVVVRGSSDLPARVIEERLGREFERVAGWTPAPVPRAAAARAGAAVGFWRFRDLDGKPWRATLAVRPTDAAAHEFTARLTIVRAG